MTAGKNHSRPVQLKTQTSNSTFLRNCGRKTGNRFEKIILSFSFLLTMGLLMEGSHAASVSGADNAGGQASSPSAGMGMDRQKGRETGLPIPRFVSIRSDKARMRVGPSADYPIRYVYHARGLPLEIIDEYGHWRQVRDSDGATGWMLSALISGRRTGLVAPWLNAEPTKTGTHFIALLSRPLLSAPVLAEMQPGVRINIKSCDGKWCNIALQEQSGSGYIQQKNIFGVYPNEIIE